MKALALDPKRRFTSAREMLKALAAWSPTAHKHVDTQSALARIDSPSADVRAPNKLNWLMAAAILGGILGLGAHLMYGKGSALMIGKLLGDMDSAQTKIKQSDNKQNTKVNVAHSGNYFVLLLYSCIDTVLEVIKDGLFVTIKAEIIS